MHCCCAWSRNSCRLTCVCEATTKRSCSAPLCISTHLYIFCLLWPLLVKISKDPWHLLLEELLAHHLPSSPQGSLNALELLTELLPLPLPMEVPQVGSTGWYANSVNLYTTPGSARHTVRMQTCSWRLMSATFSNVVPSTQCWVVLRCAEVCCNWHLRTTVLLL